VVLPAGYNNPVGCLHDQVHHTRVMNEELDQAMFEIRCLYEQEKEERKKIEVLEDLCNCQGDQIREHQIENMELEEGLKDCDELIEELGEQLGHGGDDEDAEHDDDYDGNPGNDVAAIYGHVDG
jgi:uncharacterized protein YukE